MRLFLTSILAASIQLASGHAAQAEPWRVESITINPGTFHSAVQLDAAGDYAMVVECHQESGAFELYVESPYDWEPDASYAPEVPAIVTIDGVAVSDVMFHFDDKQLGEGIRADNTSGRFGALLDRMLDAEESVALSYFDRSTNFSAEGIGEALLAIADKCS